MGIILFDVVLGYGVYEDMVGVLLLVIEEVCVIVKEVGCDFYFVVIVCGMMKDL